MYDSRRTGLHYSSPLPESEEQRLEFGRDTNDDFRLIWFRSITAIDVRLVEGVAIEIRYGEIH